jgi:hypothetical protein
LLTSGKFRGGILADPIQAWRKDQGVMDTFLAYASRGRNAWWRYLLTPVLAALFTFLTLLVITGALFLMHLLPPGIAAQMQQPKYIVPFYLGIAASFGLLTAGLALACLPSPAQTAVRLDRAMALAIFWSRLGDLDRSADPARRR